VHSYHRDGQARFDHNGGASVNYQPNSLDGPVEDPTLREPPLRLQGDADRYATREGAGGHDDFSQAGNLYRLMHSDQKAQLIENLAAAMADVPHAIQIRQLGHFYKADPDYGTRVANALGIDTRTFSHDAFSPN
jgi:catalase